MKTAKRNGVKYATRPGLVERINKKLASQQREAIGLFDLPTDDLIKLSRELGVLRDDEVFAEHIQGRWLRQRTRHESALDKSPVAVPAVTVM